MAEPRAPALLKVLLVEDDQLDAELVLHAIQSGGRQIEWQRVDTPEAFLRTLAEWPPDVIVSDYRMPRFNGADALRLRQERAADVPFLIVTGSLNEETAVECMK